MATGDTVVEIESLETGLLSPSPENGTVDADDDSPVLFTASFREMEENFVKYQTAQWVLCSLVLILAWGIGVFMLLYLPLRRYVLRRDFRSRKLFLTPNAIVYKVTKPVLFPCFGVLKKEKYVLLPSVADVVIEQGYLQSLFGIYSVRIENGGVRRPSSDDLHIQGLASPSAFRKAILTHLANMRTDAFSRQISVIDDTPSLRAGHSLADGDVVAPDELIFLQKLEEAEASIKRVQTLIETQQSLASERAD